MYSLSDQEEIICYTTHPYNKNRTAGENNSQIGYSAAVSFNASLHVGQVGILFLFDAAALVIILSIKQMGVMHRQQLELRSSVGDDSN